MNSFKTLLVLLVISLGSSVTTLFFKNFYCFGLLCLTTFLIGKRLMNILIEEAIVYKVMEAGNYISFGKIVEYAGKRRAKTLVNKLIKKNILEKSNNEICLIEKNYQFTVPAFRSDQLSKRI